MDIKPNKFLCAFNSMGWSKFDAKKLEEYAKRHLKEFKAQDSQENLCEDCNQLNDHIFYDLQIINWETSEYEQDFAITFELERKNIDENISELTIIQCSNCGNWRVAL